ncbi:MAG: glycosyltransferase [Caldilineaceae bacterium]|nr:glycosyltransferase [Caldilineaceae bacterium]
MVNILILLSDTGGGHRASAEALQAEFSAHRHAAAFRTTIVDLLSDHLGWPLNYLPRGYPVVTDRAAWLWKFLWHSTARRGIATPVNRWVASYSRQRLVRMFRQHAPDLIISTHPLVQELALRTLKGMPLDAPYVTVVTDLVDVHPLWYHHEADLSFVASDEAYARARAHGLQPAQLRRCGLPVRPAFLHQTRDRPTARRSLGMTPELPAALIVGGGDGIGPIEAIAQQMAARFAEDRKPAGQLVIICGRNQRLHQRLTRQSWPVPVHVRGFVDNMADWMSACDCMVTKAGPGAISEALVLGLPMVLSGCIPGQEEGNIPYVVENGAGVYCVEPATIATLVKGWFEPPQTELATMSQRALGLAQPSAAASIVNEIVAYFDATGRAYRDKQPGRASTALALHRA